MKHRLTPEFRSRLAELKRSVIDAIVVKTTFNCDLGNKIELEDNRGSLIINHINDDEAEVIMSLERKSDNELTVWSGIYDEEREYGLEDFDIPTLINILDALEAAIENE